MLPLLALLCFLPTPASRSQAVEPPIGYAELTHAVQVATSVRELANDKLRATRDQAWLAFVGELYKRRPDFPPGVTASVYARYTNAFETLVARLDRYTAIPSSTELYGLILQAAPQIPEAPHAIDAALRLAQDARVQAIARSGSLDEALSSGALILEAEMREAQKRLTSPALDSLKTLVSDTLEQASRNPDFGETIRTTLSTQTGIQPTDSLEQMLERFPRLRDNTVISTLAKEIAAPGGLQNAEEIVQDLFHTQLQRASGIVEAAVTDLAKSLDAPAGKVADYVLTTIPRLAEGIDPLVQNLREDFLGTTTESLDVLSFLLEDDAPDLAKVLGPVGQAMTTLGEVANGFDFSDLAGGLGQLATGDILGAVFSVFGGAAGPSAGEKQILQKQDLILDGVKQIGADLSLLRTNINERFDAVDRRLNQLYDGMQLGFRTLTDSLESIQNTQSALTNQIANQFILLSDRLDVVQDDLFRREAELARFERDVHSYFLAESIAEFRAKVNDFLAFRERTGRSLTTPEFYAGNGGPETSFYNWATENSKLGIWAPYRPGGSIDDLVALYDKDTDPAARLNSLNVVAAELLGVAPLRSPTQEALPNPTIWAMSANAYAQLARENPGPFRSLPSRIQPIQSLGRAAAAGLQSITLTNQAGRSGINWPLWRAAFQLYREQLGPFKAALDRSQMLLQVQLNLGFTNLDFLRETAYVELIAEGLPVSGGRTNLPPSPADFNLGPLYPAAEGGVRGLIHQINGTYAVAHLSPEGTRKTTVVTAVEPTLDGQPMNLSWSGPHLWFASAAISPEGRTFLTPGIRGYQDPQNDFGDIFYDRLVCELQPDGNLTTLAGNPDRPETARDGTTGPGGTARFSNPRLVGFQANRLYLLDGARLCVVESNVVRTLSTSATLAEVFHPLNGFFSGFDSWNYHQYPGANLAFGQGDPPAVFLPLTQRLGRLDPGSPILTPLPPLSLNGSPPGFSTPGTSFFRQGLALASGNGETWVLQLNPTGASLSTLRPGQVTPEIRWRGSASPGPFRPGPLAQANFAVTVCSSLAVDPFGNLYVTANDGSPVAGPDGVNQLLRIGPPRERQIDLFNHWQRQLNTSTELHTRMRALDAAKALIRDFVTLGLSASYLSDDLLHSLLEGSLGVLDSSVAANAIQRQVQDLSLGPRTQLLDLPELGLRRIDALETQIGSRLLDIQSRATTPADSLVFNLTLDPRPNDLSPRAVAIRETGQPVFSPRALASPRSLAASNPSARWTDFLEATDTTALNFGTDTDFSVGFWAHPSTSTNHQISVASQPTDDLATSGWSITLTPGLVTATVHSPRGAPLQFTHELPARSASNWVHAALVICRPAASAYLYVDGRIVATSRLPADFAAFGTGRLVMGGNHVGGANPDAVPVLNEVALWRRALGPAEMEGVHAAGLASLALARHTQSLHPKPNPTEPLALVDSTLRTLDLLTALHDAPELPPHLTQVRLLPGLLQGQVLGTPGLTYRIETSPDLHAWTNHTNVIESGTFAVPIETGRRSLFVRASPAP